MNQSQNSKNILLVAHHLSTGGMPQFLLKKIQALLSHDNVNVFLIEIQDVTGGKFIVQREQIIELLKDRFFSINNDYNLFIRLIDTIKPHNIHFEEFVEFFLPDSISNQIFIDDRSYTISETTHDSGFDPKQKRFFPDSWQFVSKYTEKRYQHYNIPIQVIEYPINKKPSVDRKQGLEKLGLDPNKFHVLNVGLFSNRKNQREIVEYAKILKEDGYDDIVFHFVGNLADNFQDYWKPIVETLPNNCVIWGERKDVDSFYSCMDLFLFTSLGNPQDLETNPLVIKEAISWDMKVFLYNLPVYENKFNYEPNVTLLSNDKLKNINLILEKFDDYMKFKNNINMKNVNLVGIDLKTKRIEWMDECGGVNILEGLKELCDDNFLNSSVDVGVEIGSFAGVSSNLISRYCNTLYCVDQWQPYSEINDNRIIDAEKLFDEFVSNKKNIIKIKGDSVSSSQKFEDESIDFVYIDASHDELSVTKDIAFWLPKIKKTGIVTGHDFNQLGVKNAVLKYFNKSDIKLYSDSSWSAKKIDAKNPQKITLFFHALLTKDWETWIEPLIKYTVTSELYDNCESYFINYLDTENYSKDFLKLVEKYDRYKKIRLRQLKENNYELDTLYDLWEYAKNNDCYILYYHSKGVSIHDRMYSKYDESDKNKYFYNIKFVDNVQDEKIIENVKVWNRFLGYWTVSKWREHINNLKSGYSVSGSLHFNYILLNNYITNSFNGNFWWANSDHIKKLLDPFVFQKIFTDINFDQRSIEDNKRGSAEVWVNSVDYIWANIKESLLDPYFHGFQNEHNFLPDYQNIYEPILIESNFDNINLNDNINFLEITNSNGRLTSYFGTRILNSYNNINYDVIYVGKDKQSYLSNINNDSKLVIDVKNDINQIESFRNRYKYIIVNGIFGREKILDITQSVFPYLEKDGIIYVVDDIKNIDLLKNNKSIKKLNVTNNENKTIDFEEVWNGCLRYKIQQKQKEFIPFLQYLVENKKTKNCLEIGFYDAGTSKGFCEIFDNVYSFDISLEKDIWKELKLENQNWNYYSMDSHSLDCYNFVKNLNVKFDCIFIDGDHSYEGVKQDYLMYKEFLAEGGVIGFHDILDTQTHRDLNCFVSDLWNELKIDYEFVEIIDDKNLDKSIGGWSNDMWGGIGLITNKLNIENRPILICNHNYLINDWEDVVREQWLKIQRYGVYDKANKIISGVYSESEEEYLKFVNIVQEKDYKNIVEIKRWEINDRETFTLNYLLNFSKNSDKDYNVLYYHTKGVFQTKNPDVDPIALAKWRECIEYFNLIKWRESVHLLDENDIVGAMHIKRLDGKDIFSGNFWWSHTKHIKNLSEIPVGDTYILEPWIFTSPNTFLWSNKYIFDAMNINPYIDYIEPKDYSDDFYDPQNQEIYFIENENKFDFSYRGSVNVFEKEYKIYICDYDSQIVIYNTSYNLKNNIWVIPYSKNDSFYDNYDKNNKGFSVIILDIYNKIVFRKDFLKDKK